MARPLRLEYEGAVYHVTIRGNQRGIIFQEDSDRERFIEKLAESVERYEIHLYLYTLMTNHVHMVLETPRANLSQFMHRLQTAYTVFYNRQHKLSGHLLQGRFGSTVVKEDEYILKLGLILGSALRLVIYFLAFFSSIVYSLSGPEDQS
jgi:REP element-mobilizing transposase RayT